ncbi:MAG: CPXCG motif-containing cysteine-rich protein [Candidatus Omnitrophica bacterium]|nr:CPXCG motif-containing cysteine-rich protein [Candidatus Omnitrophota bacterium]
MAVSEEYNYACPCCGGDNSLLIDLTAGSRQQFVTDCEVCCRPLVISLCLSGTDITDFEAAPE